MENLRTTASAAVLTGEGRVEIAEVKPLQPGLGEVRVRLQGCGVCVSNLPVWEGRPWFRYPLASGAPGHEGWGIIDALGPEVSDFYMGQRVSALSHNAYAAYDIAASDALVPLPAELDKQPFPGEPVREQRQKGADPGAGLQALVAVEHTALHRFPGKHPGELLHQLVDRSGQHGRYRPRHRPGSHHLRLMSANNDRWVGCEDYTNSR